MITHKKSVCLLCNYDKFTEFLQSVQLKAVTSDCKLWDNGGLVKVCMRCGHIQKQMDLLWQKEVAQIYANYDVYHLSDGNEQVVFSGGLSSPRSLQILKRLEEQIGMPEEGCLLDVGCGNGELLRSFNKRYPGWILAGYEQDHRYDEEITQIPGVKHFYSGKLDRVDCKFNLITLIHVLEHIPQPLRLLKQLREKLTRSGLLLIHVPDISRNPFDLVVMDHCSHFIQEKLAQLVNRAGFEIMASAVDWVPNYITLVSRISELKAPEEFAFDKAGLNDILKLVEVNIKWLEGLINHAREIAAMTNFGIFGTAIAGTWLAGVLKDKVHFFIDEDPLRIDKVYLGRKVLGPADAPLDSRLYLALPPETIGEVHSRLEKCYPSLKLVIPPPLSSGVIAEAR